MHFWKYNAIPLTDFCFHISEYVLRQFNMCPKYCIPQEEMEIKNDNDHRISSYVFNNVHRWSKHGLLFDEKKCNLCIEKTNGTVTKRKRLLFLRETLGIYFKDNVLPTMEMYAYHQPHFFLLRKNGTTKDRKIALKSGDFETTRDYEER